MSGSCAPNPCMGTEFRSLVDFISSSTAVGDIMVTSDAVSTNTLSGFPRSVYEMITPIGLVATLRTGRATFAAVQPAAWWFVARPTRRLRVVMITTIAIAKPIFPTVMYCSAGVTLHARQKSWIWTGFLLHTHVRPHR